MSVLKCKEWCFSLQNTFSTEVIDLDSYSFLRAVHNPPEVSITVVKPAVRCPLHLECTIDFAQPLYGPVEIELLLSIQNAEIYFPGTYLKNFHSLCWFKIHLKSLWIRRREAGGGGAGGGGNTLCSSLVLRVFPIINRHVRLTTKGLCKSVQVVEWIVWWWQQMDGLPSERRLPNPDALFPEHAVNKPTL